MNGMLNTIILFRSQGLLGQLEDVCLKEKSEGIPIFCEVG